MKAFLREDQRRYERKSWNLYIYCITVRKLIRKKNLINSLQKWALGGATNNRDRQRIKQSNRRRKKDFNGGKYDKTEEIASKRCGKSKNNEKTQLKELGCAEREDHRRAEDPSAKRVFGDGDARPELASWWWPAHRRCASGDGGHAK